MKRFIFITGPSGSGKTTVGKILAQKLGYEFLDTDEIIKQITGKEIKDIFLQDGEEYFRFLETKVIREVVQKEGNFVVSLGGGAIVNPQNLHTIRNNGLVINLLGKPEKLSERIKGNLEERPLLKGSSPEEKLKQLISQREKWYKINDFYVDTTEKNPYEVAEEILNFLKLTSLVDFVRVNLAERSYDIIVGYKIFDSLDVLNYLSAKLKRIFPQARKTVILSFNSIKDLMYSDERRTGEAILDFLSKLGFETFELNLPEGESTKDVFYAIYTWNYFSDLDIKKSDFLSLLGGGVIGDLGGFIAACWLRGIGYINIPTTLLSQVDSSIGGKTGVNTLKAKNIIGVIYQPSAVISDIKFVETLPDLEFLSGMGEVIKYALSLSYELYEFLLKNKQNILKRDPEHLKNIVSLSSSLKAKIVSEDEKEESGLRMILNTGHTIGHAIESSLGFSIPHGLAVALGLVAESKISFAISGNSKVYDAAKQIFNEFFSGVDWSNFKKNIDRQKFFSSMKLDKKTRGNKLKFPVLVDVGKTEIYDIEIDEFQKLSEYALEDLEKL
jgi:3-dehydroquinate synthetase